ncbi:uncharacterized protein PS065_016869 [Dugong dugon]
MSYHGSYYGGLGYGCGGLSGLGSGYGCGCGSFRRLDHGFGYGGCGYGFSLSQEPNMSLQSQKVNTGYKGYKSIAAQIDVDIHIQDLSLNSKPLTTPDTMSYYGGYCGGLGHGYGGFGGLGSGYGCGCGSFGRLGHGFSYRGFGSSFRGYGFGSGFGGCGYGGCRPSFQGGYGFSSFC